MSYLLFEIKNNNYEIFIMWFLLISTILLLLCLLVIDVHDQDEVYRVI